MATGREAPLVARNFQVRFAILGPRGGRVDEREVACSRVVFPPFRLDDRAVRDDIDEHAPSNNLVLRRGHTGSADFYEWWRAERDSERDHVREVTVALLDEAHEPVTVWNFTGCRIVSLEYSALDAIEVGILEERLELSFKSVEQISVGR